MTRLNFFSHQKIADNAYIVTENYGVSYRLSIGVITGLEKTAVVNSGLGISGSLRKYIEQFAGTDKPFLVYCTSGKREHTGGAAQFDEVFVSSLDKNIGTYKSLSPVPKEILNYGCSISPEKEATEFCELRPGFISIGRQHISPKELAGNTPGSFVIINGENRLCFLGDAVGSSCTILPYLDRDGMADYSQSLIKLTQERGGELSFYCSDSVHPLSHEYILNTAGACAQIASCNFSGDIPTGEDNMRMKLYKNAAVIYDVDKI